MNVKIISSLLLCGAMALFAGCVSTVDGHSKSGNPMVKDSIPNTIDRTVPQVQAAARKVLSENGTLTDDHIAANTLEAIVKDRTVWVNMVAVDSQDTTYTVQARTKWGGDVELAATISTRIALELQAMSAAK